MVSLGKNTVIKNFLNLIIAAMAFSICSNAVSFPLSIFPRITQDNGRPMFPGIAPDASIHATYTLMRGGRVVESKSTVQKFVSMGTSTIVEFENVEAADHITVEYYAQGNSEVCLGTDRANTLLSAWARDCEVNVFQEGKNICGQFSSHPVVRQIILMSLSETSNIRMTFKANPYQLDDVDVESRAL